MVRLGLKYLKVTNALAYYANNKFTIVKKLQHWPWVSQYFTTDDNLIKLFIFVTGSVN